MSESFVPDLSASSQHHHHLHIVIMSKDDTRQGTLMTVV